MVIKRIIETDDRAGRFINEAFTDYAIKSNVKLNYIRSLDTLWNLSEMTRILN